jgi:hypothetical protein
MNESAHCVLLDANPKPTERPMCIRTKCSARTRQTAQHRMIMAYAHGSLMLAVDWRIFDTPLGARHEHLTSSLGSRQCFQSSITALARLGHKFQPDITTPVLISLTRAAKSTTNAMPNAPTAPPLPQSVPILAYSPSNKDFSMHERRQLRFHAA